MEEREPFHWRYSVLCALLWCVGVTLFNTLTAPIGDLSWQDATSFTIKVGVGSLAGGLVWALSTEWTKSRPPLAMFCLQLPVAAMASVAGACVPIQGLFHYSGGTGRLMSNVPLVDLVCQTVWLYMLCGGVYVLGYHVTRRAMRLRRQLSELRLACGEAEMRLREMRLHAYQGQIRPSTLLEALQALQLRYAVDRAAGDQLFDRLVDFLRAAMPGLRGGVSTLSAELAIVSRYAMLRNALKDEGPRWQLMVSLPHMETSCIPLRLLASLDQIDRCVPSGQIIEITSATLAGIFGLKIIVHVPGLNDKEAHRLKADLESTLGADTIVMSEPRGALSLDLRLPESAVSPAA